MNNILNTLGICSKAGGLVSGEDFVVEGIRTSKVKYVFLASDAGVNTKKKITDKCLYYGVTLNDEFNSMELSKAIGKSNRKVVGITNPGFVKILEK